MTTVTKHTIGSLDLDEALKDYDPNISQEDFKKKYAGVYAKDEGKRLSKSSMRKIFRKFLKEERIDFFKHHDFTLQDVVDIGIDKFVYTMGWTKPAKVRRWRNNKVRVGICLHCKDQFLPLIYQTNHGLCHNCRPLYSATAMRNFALAVLSKEKRYENAHRDFLMDFYIMFANDDKLRRSFLKGSDNAMWAENLEVETPEWITNEQEHRHKQFDPANIIDVEAKESHEVEDES